MLLLQLLLLLLLLFRSSSIAEKQTKSIRSANRNEKEKKKCNFVSLRTSISPSPRTFSLSPSLYDKTSFEILLRIFPIRFLFVSSFNDKSLTLYLSRVSHSALAFFSSFTHFLLADCQLYLFGVVWSIYRDKKYFKRHSPYSKSVDRPFSNSVGLSFTLRIMCVHTTSTHRTKNRLWNAIEKKIATFSV